MPLRSSSGSLSGQPGPRSVAACADLADQGEVVRVGVQRLADERVGDVGPVELRGVDVVDAELDGAAQHGERLVAVTRRPETPGPGSCMAPKPMRETEKSPRA